MRTLSASFTCATLFVACAVSDQRITHPSATPGRTTAVFAVTEPAPAGSVLRVFVDPDKLVGWIAGSTSYAGKVVSFDGHATPTVVDRDNSFELRLAFPHRAEAEVRVGDLAQRVTIEPAVTTEPAAYVVTDRGAYRPGQKLQLTAFLRRLEKGELKPALASPVEVQIVSDTKKTVAAKLALTVDASGRASGDYTFSPADPLDTYTVQIPGYRGTAKVTLAEYRKAKVKLDVDASIVDGDARLSFRALDFLDHGVAGGAVSFKAQIVREPEDKPAQRGFAFEGPAVALQRDEILLHAADPDRAGRLWDAGRYVVRELAGTVELDGKGTGAFRVPLESSYLRGRHDLVVESTMVDPNGYEQRTTRKIPLARRDHRVQIDTAHALVASGSPVDVTVRVTDAAGRLVVPASTSVAAIRISPPENVVVDYNNYNNNYNGVTFNNGLPNQWVGGPNGGHWGGNGYWVGGPNGYWVSTGNNLVNVPNCRFTNSGCRVFGRSAPRAAQLIPDDTLAATAAVIGDTASLAIPDPGAYRLIASARLLDGSTVWGEAGVAVRERTRMPDVVLELDRSELDHGDKIAGVLHARYRGPALLVVRDASGIKSRHRATVDGSLRFALPSEGLTYGASVEAYLLGEERAIEVAQQPLHVTPRHRGLAVQLHAKDTYGPGDTVDLDIEAGEVVDLAVSVYDQGLLGIAPDRSVDPRTFFFGDDRVHARTGLATLRAQLGDLTVGQILDLAKTRANAAKRTPEGNFEREAAALIANLYGNDTRFTVGAALHTLRYLGIPATASPAASSQGLVEPAKESERLADLLARLPNIAFVRAGDTIAMFDPAQEVMKPIQGVSFSGAATGNATYSVGNASHSYSAPTFSYVPAGPSALSGAESNSTIRRDFSDSAFWSGTTRTDATGRARVRFKLPDSLTNWQVVVTAIGRQAVGRSTAKLRTTRDVMIWPLLPRQMVEGDAVTIGASVHNMTDRDREIAVALQTENVDVLSPATLTVHVPRGTSVPVSWNIRARSAGLATLLASAATPGAPPDASLKRIPINASSAEQTVTASGFATKPIQLELPDGVDPRSTRLELTFAPSLAADLAKTLDYLVAYPYGCAEQTMSKFAPAIEVAGVLENLGIRDGALVARLPGVVDGGLKRLTELQQPDGGWGWIGSSTTHEMITPYVVWGLLRAERAGYKLPDPKTLSRGLEKIFAFAQSLGDRQLSDRMYLMYVYGQKHRLPDAWWTWLTARADKMSDYALALALELAVKRGEKAIANRFADELGTRAIKAEHGVRWASAGFSRWMEDPFEVSAAVLAALVAHDPSNPLVTESIAYFTATKRGDRWNSTKDTAMVLYAMTAYIRAQRLGAGKSSMIDFTVDGAPHHLTFGDGLSRTVTLQPLTRKPTIAFTNASPGILVRAVARYRTAGRTLAPMSHGLAVTRTVTLIDANGRRTPLKSGDRVKRGSYIESVVRVDSGQQGAMRFLLVEDPKPAGAEALPETDRRLGAYGRPYVFREDRETHVAFHHEQTPSTTQTATLLHLETAGDLAFVPASAELMYQTQTRGHSGSFTLRVE